MKKASFLFLFIQMYIGYSQTWPSETWKTATNLTSVMDVSGVTDLSGLHWNPINNRLYAVQNNGKIRILELNVLTNAFQQIANKSISGGPEGITQANLYANEFYTIDENNYQIRRYTHNTNFSTVSLFKHWNLLLAPSPMINTGNNGPEGIVFIPDNLLFSIGFISQQTGQVYTSKKGLGGLFFIANQDKGYIWVYDINPNSNDDFLFVGKYQTNSSESCDLSLDRSTGLLYILHNVSDNNILEVTDLSSEIVNGNEMKFIVKNEYDIPNPGGSNENIEGFALTSKCPESGVGSAWLCRDVSTNENSALKQDALRWFKPFAADGICSSLRNDTFESFTIQIYPNPSNQQIRLVAPLKIETIQISNTLGQVILKNNKLDSDSIEIDVSQFQTGIYTIGIFHGDRVIRSKFIKY